jgi:hypothetical protein
MELFTATRKLKKFDVCTMDAMIRAFRHGLLQQ